MKYDNKGITPDNTAAFEEIVAIIERARENAFRAVNHELISMYWEIGHFISRKVTADNWGKSVVQEFSRFIQSHFVGIKGFSPQNIWRMKQFYETYAGNEKGAVRKVTHGQSYFYEKRFPKDQTFARIKA